MNGITIPLDTLHSWIRRVTRPRPCSQLAFVTQCLLMLVYVMWHPSWMTTVYLPIPNFGLVCLGMMILTYDRACDIQGGSLQHLKGPWLLGGVIMMALGQGQGFGIVAITRLDQGQAVLMVLSGVWLAYLALHSGSKPSLKKDFLWVFAILCIIIPAWMGYNLLGETHPYFWLARGVTYLLAVSCGTLAHAL